MKKKKVSFAMLLLGASALGVLAGYVIGEPIAVIKPLGTLFTRLLFMLVPGLVFFSIASSFANIADIRKLSKWAGKIIGWFMLTTLIGTVIGTVTGLFFQPGKGITLPEASYEVTKVSAQNYIESDSEKTLLAHWRKAILFRSFSLQSLRVSQSF